MIQLFNWFRRGSLERGLDRELQYHFDRRVADLIAAGIPDIEARRRVTVELGLAQVREEVRDVWAHSLAPRFPLRLRSTLLHPLAPP